jgi:hypothetical protein
MATRPPTHVDTHAAQRAHASVFVDGVVGGAVLSVLSIVWGHVVHPSIPLFAWVAAMVIDFWIRFAIVKRRLVAVTDE